MVNGMREQMVAEVRNHLVNDIIPFWKALRDNEYGGYYGFMDYDLQVDKEAVKGCILNSRITWFFANAYMVLKDETLLDEARHGFDFMVKHCLDQENGGIYWSVKHNGEPEETLKHTYNQAFSIYALSSYYDASKDQEALKMAYDLFHLIEDKCTDDKGYREAFSRDFIEIDNDKLSENGIMADKTMNTLLHVFEAYTELYRVDHNLEVKKRLEWIMDTFVEKVYNAKLHRQEVFFDQDWNSIIDLHSYGHDIETAWLLDRGVEILGEAKYQELIAPVTKDLTAQIYKVAFDGNSLANECEKGVVDTKRIWWVQAETVIGFLNGYQKEPDKQEYLQAAENEWDFIRTHVVDQRKGSEWFWAVDSEGKPYPGMPIVEPWKCPYHNGRMCLEVIKREGLGDE